jgi:AraC family transcriptional regulator
MTAAPLSRIEAYENRRRIPVSPRPPALSTSTLLGEHVILERHVTPEPAKYGERHHPSHVVFLHDTEPTLAACRTEGQRFNGWVHPGDVWIVPRSARHTSTFQGPHGGLVLSIENPQFERHIAALMHGGRIELGPQFNVKDSQLEHLLRGLLAVAQDGSRADALVGDLLVNAICIRLAKRYAVSRLNVVPRRGGLPAPRLKKVLEYVDANLDNNIRLSALAATANISLYYFATLFRQSMGLSPHRYVLQQRIERAEGLLRNTKLSVLEVSLHLGFEHQNNFARAFRRVTGVSPTHFRQEVQ